MNIFVVGMPMKVFAGLILLWIISPLIGEIFIILADSMTFFSLDIIELMRPL
jgi:flagellar biosynthesis protein FliR